MYDPAEEEARAARTARQQAEDFKKAMKKITLHSVGVPAVRRDRNRYVRCKRAVIHSDFKLKKEGGKK